MSLDSETGESIVQNFDMETGECFDGKTLEEELEEMEKKVLRKTKFNVPKSYLKSSQLKSTKQKCCISTQETFTLSSKQRVIQLKEVS